MASIYDIKPGFQKCLRPLTCFFAKAGVTANQVTLAALVLSVVVGGLLYFSGGAKWALFILPAFLFIRMALNAIDGMLAREHGMKSDLGAMLNEVGDVVSDSALYLPFVVVAGIDVCAIVMIVLLSIISEMTGVVAIQIGASRRYDGPMGKSDRAFVFGVLAFVLAVGVPAGKWLAVILWVIVALLVWTIVNRAGKALKEV